MDACEYPSDNDPMSRYVPHLFAADRCPRYIVVWTLQWVIVERTELEANSNFEAAMSMALRRWSLQGWEVESGYDYGFAFLRQGSERRLMAMTPRDPNDQRPQSFNPYRSLTINPPDDG